MENRFQNHDESILKARTQDLYNTPGDIRSEYFRDYCRILHSTAYRRLKHKTQVFFNVGNDHVCTRMEHVHHVESVSHTIAIGLGLNCELTSAIAIGHDLGHAPFGHHGETILNSLMKEYMTVEYREKHFGNDPDKLFWHERNGLRFVDMIELLPDHAGIKKNLNLTYAVRDGIISHCGEIDESILKPREDDIDLYKFNTPGKFAPYTWEGCAVKIADKIAYLGRDIEDALILKFISNEGKIELKNLARDFTGKETLNTTDIMHSLISDICLESTPDSGLTMSHDKYELLCEIKKYNYKYIYKNPLFNVFQNYAKLILESIFKVLYTAYDREHTISNIRDKYKDIYPKLTDCFTKWLKTYCVHSLITTNKNDDNSTDVDYLAYLKIEKIYCSLDSKDVYVQAIIDFISGMTDAFAIELPMNL